MKKNSSGIYGENQLQVDESNKKKKFLPILIWCLVVVTVVLGSFFFTRTYIVRWPILGTSMVPTIHNKDDVLLFKTQNVNYDDVIIFFTSEIKKTSSDGENLIKRVIGKEGDVISYKYDIENNCYHLYRNDVLLSEDKISEPMSSKGGFYECSVTVPEGCYYVLGDNRNYSTDSSEGIYAKKSQIVGKVFFRIPNDSNAPKMGFLSYTLAY